MKVALFTILTIVVMVGINILGAMMGFRHGVRVNLQLFALLGITFTYIYFSTKR